MIAWLLFALPFAGPTPVAGPDHLRLHPAGVDLYAEVPDVSALLRALREAPLLEMLADEDVRSALAVLGLRPPDLGAALERLVRARVGEDGLPLVLELRTLSLSMSLPERSVRSDGPGLQLVADYPSAELAARAEGLLRTRLGTGGGEALRLELGDLTVDGWCTTEGARLLAGFGSVDLEGPGARAAGEEPSLASDERAQALVAGLALGGGGGWDGPGGIVVARGLWPRSFPTSLDDDDGAAPGTPQEPEDYGRRFVSWMSDDRLHPLPGPTSWRMSFADGRYVTESFSEGGGSVERALGVRALDPTWLGLVPSGVVFAYCGSLDARALAELVVGTPEEEAPAAGATAGALTSLEKLGPRFVLYVQPIGGPSLPPTFLWAELQDPKDFQDELATAIAVLGAPHAITVSSRDFRVLDPATGERVPVPITTVELPEGALVGPPLNVSPSFALFEGRLLASLSGLNLRRELKRLLERGGRGEEDGALELGFPLPADARSVVFLDWGTLLESAVALVRALAPMASAMAGPEAGLPDPGEIPAPEIFTRFFRPTTHCSRRVEGGLQRRHESSFGPEAWLGAAAAIVVGQQKAEAAVEELEIRKARSHGTGGS